MALISSNVARCHPGRRDDFMAVALEGMKLFERHGARHVRLLAAATAGEMSMGYVLTNEFANAEDYGAFVDELYSDAELDSFLGRITAADSPLVIESRSLATEIPLERSGTPGPGGVIEVYVGRPVPGRFEACRTLAGRVFDFFEGRGATNCRLFQLFAAGAMTDALVFVWEFENMRARGAASDAWWTAEASRAVRDELSSPDNPITPLSSGIYRDRHM